jgi:hypothetical protein
MICSINPLVPPINVRLTIPECDGKKVQPSQVGMVATVDDGKKDWYGQIIFVKQEKNATKDVVVAQFTEIPRFPEQFSTDGTPHSFEKLLKQVLKIHLGLTTKKIPYQFTEAANHLDLERSNVGSRLLRAIPLNPFGRIKALRGWVYKSYKEQWAQLLAGDVLKKTIETRVSLLPWINRFLLSDSTDLSENDAMPESPPGTVMFSVIPNA